jgi:membrane-associated phospholipid phosphatase
VFYPGIAHPSRTGPDTPGKITLAADNRYPAEISTYCGDVESAPGERRPLVPPGLRVPVLVVAILCGLVVAVLGVLFHGERYGTDLDQHFYWLVHHEFLGERGLLRAMLVPTEPALHLVVLAIVVGYALAKRRWRVAALAVAAPLVVVLLNTVVLKPVFGRTINHGSLAFPSGHTALTVSVLTVLTITIVARVRPPWRKAVTSLLIIGSLVTTAIAATALVGNRYHYLTDTMGGFCVAVATVLLMAVAIDWIAPRVARVRVLRSG